MQEITTTTLNLYIPRILANVKQNRIKSTFHELNIGSIYYIDMHHRINENKNPYYFAFISIKLYLTQESAEFYQSLLEKRIVNIIYDSHKEQYWEVKLHIEKEQRQIQPLKPVFKYLSVTEYEECKLSAKQGDSDYRNGLDNEYELLQKEIFATVFTPNTILNH